MNNPIPDYLKSDIADATQRRDSLGAKWKMIQSEIDLLEIKLAELRRERNRIDDSRADVQLKLKRMIKEAEGYNPPISQYSNVAGNVMRLQMPATRSKVQSGSAWFEMRDDV